MERFDITIRMYSADASGTQYVWDRVPAEEGDFVLYTDAQETIAALQARVRELEEWVQDQSTANLETMRHMDEMQSRAMDAESQLTQRTAELQTARCDAVRAFVHGEDKMCLVCGAKEPCELKNDPSSPCTFEPPPMELLKALRQRTAELEAAKAELEQERVRLASCLIATEGGTKDIVKQGDYGWSPAYQATLNLQAELERVRADNKALDKWRADVTVSLQRPEGAFFVDVPQHIKDLVKERDELRALIAALPKVDGEIEIYTGKNTNQVVVTYKRGVIIGTLYGLDHAKPVAALYKHRQGMEG